jgi:hypothetical protein
MTAPATWPASAADLVAEHPGSLAALVTEGIAANA